MNTLRNTIETWTTYYLFYYGELVPILNNIKAVQCSLNVICYNPIML